MYGCGFCFCFSVSQPISRLHDILLLLLLFHIFHHMTPNSFSMLIWPYGAIPFYTPFHSVDTISSQFLTYLKFCLDINGYAKFILFIYHNHSYKGFDISILRRLIRDYKTQCHIPQC